MYSCTLKRVGKNDHIGEFVVKHISTADYIVTDCDDGNDGENLAEQCTSPWASAENDTREDFTNWQEEEEEEYPFSGG